MSSVIFQPIEASREGATASRGRHLCPGESDIAAIDYATCGISDVIAHFAESSIPPLLSDHLRAYARAHAQFANPYDNREVMRNELDFADRLHSFADAIDLGDYTIPDDVDLRCEAFSCAAWLQDLHPIMQKVIAEREDARSARPTRSG